MDESLQVLLAHRDRWAALDAPGRLAILEAVERGLHGVADRWVAAGLVAKHIPPATIGEGEEWGQLAALFHALRQLKQSMREIARFGQPRIPGPLYTRPDGRVIARVFPRMFPDRMLQPRVTGEVWMPEGVTEAEVRRTQAWAYKAVGAEGQVALVLGAGNSSMLPVADALHKLFVEGQVVLLKMNPVNAYLGPFMEEALRPLTGPGYLRLVRGGADQGAYLCRHPAVDEIHMTGSAKTYEAIVFGPGEEGRIRKEQRRPLINRPVTAELGNVTPVIVVPGPWSDREVNGWAGRIASWFVNNAGFNCLTPRVIIQHKAWPQREALLKALGRKLSNVATRRAYYPGAAERHRAFLAAHPEARVFGTPREGHLPWTLVADANPERRDDPCFTTEAFCSLCAETALDAGDAVEFIDRAVAFANDALWGTLAAAIIVHPRSLADPRIAEAMDRAIANLRYGMICVNIPASEAYFAGTVPWGGCPGRSERDIQSGTGWTNNPLMFRRPQKSVVRGPFAPFIDPLGVTSKRPHEAGRRLACFEAKPSAGRLVRLAWSVLRTL